MWKRGRERERKSDCERDINERKVKRAFEWEKVSEKDIIVDFSKIDNIIYDSAVKAVAYVRKERKGVMKKRDTYATKWTFLHIEQCNTLYKLHSSKYMWL